MVVNTNITGNLSFLDLGLFFTTVFYTITYKSIKIKFRTFKIIIVLNAFLFLAIIPLLWTGNKVQSLLYYGQVVFAFNIIPLFIDRLIQINAYEKFLKRIHQTIYVVAILFVIFAVLHFKYGEGSWLFFGLKGNHRLAWGDGFVGNDLTQFMVLGFLLNEHFIKSKKKRGWLSIFIFLVFLLTLSRTMLLVGVIYFFLRYTKKTILFGSLIFSISIIILSLNISYQSESRFDRLLDFKTSATKKGGRLSTYTHVIENTVDFVFQPVYGQSDNLKGDLRTKGVHKMSSVHNILLSVLVNFGLFPFLFLYITVFAVLMKIIYNRKFYNFNTFFIFLLLIFIVISLNAFMLSRALWMPIFIILSFLDKQRQDSKIKITQ